MKRTIYDEDHEAFRASVKEFLDREVIPHLEEYAEAHALPREFWLAAGKQGFLGLEIPEEYGGVRGRRLPVQRGAHRGAGQGQHDAAVAASASTPTSWRRTSCTSPPRSRRSAGCRGSAPASCSTAIGMTEPSGGSDLANLKTTAVRDGDDWVINGSKTFITNGYSADLVVVAARTRPEKKARASRCSASTPTAEGFARRPQARQGRPGRVRHRRAVLRRRPGPHDDLIGPLDTGFISMMQFLPQERLGSAITNLAHAKQILDETIQYAKDRQAFGQPIGSLPAQPVPARRPRHPGRGHPGVRRPVRARAHREAS